MKLKLTKEQYLAAGQSILADPRCTPEVKAAVRRGTDGTQDAEGRYTYIPTLIGGSTWYDAIIADATTRSTFA